MVCLSVDFVVLNAANIRRVDGNYLNNFDFIAQGTAHRAEHFPTDIVVRQSLRPSCQREKKMSNLKISSLLGYYAINKQIIYQSTMR